MQDSFNLQLGRLFSAGFPGSVVLSVAETLLKKIKHRCNPDAAKPLVGFQRPEVVPYIHKVTHSLKKVASRFNVPLAFSVPQKLAQLSRRTTCAEEKGGCKKNHERRFVQCANNVVYEIPLTCGKVYIGQTGRCLNDRLREHARNLINKERSHLVDHCMNCPNCEPRFRCAKIVGRSRQKTARETLEAFLIRKAGEECVSDTSIALYKAEIDFLSRYV